MLVNLTTWTYNSTQERTEKANVFEAEIQIFRTIGVSAMNTKYLVTLVTIIETGSFQKAATKLNYTPSTVTSQIRQLEDELSIKLFEKVGRRMELTQAGRDIFPYVESILQNVEQISNYRKDVSEMTGTLRLIAPDSIFIYIMQPIIQAILHEAPHIRLVINSVPSEEVNQAIINGAADIGIDCDKGYFPDSVMHRVSKPFQACLIGSPFMNPTDLDFVSPHQRKPFSMICNEPYANYQREIEKYFDERDIVLNPHMKLQSIEAVKRSVMNNLGIAYVPQFAIQEELKSGALLQLKTELDDKSFPAVCVYHRNKWVSPQIELAFKILHEQLGIEFD